MSAPGLPGAVAVVIPARDEEETLPKCLGAMKVAAQALAGVYPSVELTVTVVLDGCSDASAAMVERFPFAQSLEVAFAAVGPTRRAGVDHALAGLGRAAGSVWVANTDADTVVPAQWLVEQCRLASLGVHLVLGTVVPDPEGLDAGRHHAWHAGHTLAAGHDHIHGANLGFRADSYLSVGGFAELSVHEDADLVARLKASGVQWAAVDSIRATTSARTLGRTPGGFASYLRELPL